MADGITLAFSGALAQSEALDVHANNLANASTVGFKGLRPVFGQILSATDAAAARAGGEPARAPIRVAELVPDLTQGALRATGAPLDLALRGPGFLAVQTAGGERYTRAGNLALSAGGALVTAQGDAVLGESGTPIRVPPGPGGGPAGAIAIDVSGELRIGEQAIGRLRVVEFDAPQAIRPEGAALWRADADAGVRPAGETEVVQGHLEESNVNVVRGLARLVRIARAHDVFQRAIQTFREVDQRVTNDIGRVR